MLFKGQYRIFRSFSFCAILLMAGMGVCVPAVVSHAADSDMSRVRMEVDPTVLPPIQPPNLPEKANAESDDKADNGSDAAESAPAAAEGINAEGNKAKEAKVEDPTVDVKSDSEAADAGESAPAVEVKALAGPGTVDSIDVDIAKGRVVLHLHTDKKDVETSSFNLQSPRRLVVDVLGEWRYDKENVLRLESDAIKHVVIGSHPDKLRLVIHFRSDIEDVVPLIKQEESGLRITIPFS
ncbi:conserved exported protein of unknown function [Pseudodesulfovibrio profundus]|uniref:AMIN domain-containing protein n=2 Tax=Pseudodesulfovibrio profundus TaxID=57320 RepID=A0A2C8F8S2_9BACT|nr:conserved exported protein of unknown function [Pseudodesulfovibrio profundus]